MIRSQTRSAFGRGTPFQACMHDFGIPFYSIAIMWRNFAVNLDANMRYVYVITSCHLVNAMHSTCARITFSQTTKKHTCEYRLVPMTIRPTHKSNQYISSYLYDSSEIASFEKVKYYYLTRTRACVP